MPEAEGGRFQVLYRDRGLEVGLASDKADRGANRLDAEPFKALLAPEIAAGRVEVREDGHNVYLMERVDVDLERALPEVAKVVAERIHAWKARCARPEPEVDSF